MALGYLGLGSNVGDRRAELQGAVDALAQAPGISVVASSCTYDTDPVGEILDQPSFLNACIAITTDLDPLALLDACKAVEAQRGRVQMGQDGYVRHAPRAIDVDLLLLGEIDLVHERLTLPHEQVLARRFVLVPLLELDVELATPSGLRLADALEALPLDEGVRRVGDRLLVPPARRA